MFTHFFESESVWMKDKLHWPFHSWYIIRIYMLLCWWNALSWRLFLCLCPLLPFPRRHSTQQQTNKVITSTSHLIKQLSDIISGSSRVCPAADPNIYSVPQRNNQLCVICSNPILLCFTARPPAPHQAKDGTLRVCAAIRRSTEGTIVRCFHQQKQTLEEWINRSASLTEVCMKPMLSEISLTLSFPLFPFQKIAERSRALLPPAQTDKKVILTEIECASFASLSFLGGQCEVKFFCT